MGNTNTHNKNSRADNLMTELVKQMEACPNAEALNEEVLMPFVTALEVVCGARGYVLNIYGETANIIFSGDPDDAEEIFKYTDHYLAKRDDNVS